MSCWRTNDTHLCHTADDREAAVSGPGSTRRDRGGRGFIGCSWNQISYASLPVVVNASWSASEGALDGTAIAGTHTRDLQLTDCFDSAQAITLAPATLREQGLRLALPPWGARAFRVMPARSARTAALA